MPVVDLDWRPYDSRGTRSKVREILTFGRVEYELCLEGGLYVIRRTDRRKKAVVVSETARGRYPDTMDAWKLIASGNAG
ncbi:hypothetical protein [Microbispora bryophytorum]|uniref:hypothetical protein n=1 Tax=Microbispora bryophytorum TaxID=1460882 RepID=UPI0033E64B4A